MKIEHSTLSNFMLFEDMDMEWSPNINIICGENSTGKTTLLKLLYSAVKPLSRTPDETSREEQKKQFVSKLQNVFRPDEGKIGRLTTRKQGSNRTDLSIKLSDRTIKVGFTSAQKNRVDYSMEHSADASAQKFDAVYLPTKEMISTVSHFTTLYEEYHLDFEEMYYDLAKLLDRPLTRGPNTQEQNAVLSSFGQIMNGSIVRENDKLFLKVEGEGKFEMGLLSDGYRKLSTLTYLILCGSINHDTILFWDEPETNMNPKMIRPIVQAISALAKMGVQVFITTHDYFVLQEFEMMTNYPASNPDQLDIRFVSLYRDEQNGELRFEAKQHSSDLEHNAIMQEFDALYDREQDLIYGG